MSARKATRSRKSAPRLTPAAVDRIADGIFEELTQFEKKARKQKQEVAVIPRDALVRKIRGETSHSPYIVSLSWNATAARGSNTGASIGVYNPDPTTYTSTTLYAHLFWGPGNMIADVGAFVNSADVRFPQFAVGIYTNPSPPINFATVNTIPLPANVAVGTYLMNWVVFLRNAFDVGTYLDRACVYTTLT
jgi:hypothetical protein